MKVCLIAPIPPFRGGIAKYSYSLAKELEKRHELLLISYSRQYPKLLFGSKSQTDPNVDAASILAEFNRLSYTLDSANPFSWFQTSQRIAAFKPDLVILPWWVAYWAPLYLYLQHFLKKKGIKIVFLCINVFEHEHSTIKNFLTRQVLSRADSVIVHSEQEKEAILELNPRATVRKHLLPIFVYDAPAQIKRDRKLNLLFFGFVRAYKGLDTLLKAVALLKDQDISLEIAGEFWNDKDGYLTLIRKLGIEDKVKILDRYLSDQDMSLCFSRADLIVLPYKKSITSGVIATAYGFRKPVLATDVGGFREVIRDGLTGKIVPADDPESFAKGIIWFLENRHIDFELNISTFTDQEMSWRSLVDMID